MLLHFKRQLWISLAIIFGSIIIAVIAFNYLASALVVGANKITADRALIDQQADSLGVIAALKNQAPKAAVYQTAMDSLLPTQDGLIGFSQWINTVAAAHQVSVSASFQGNIIQPAGSDPGQAAFSMDVTGSLNDIAAFLNDAESKASGFFITVNSFNLIDKNSTYDLTGQGNVLFRP